jgi:hypothetical protein
MGKYISCNTLLWYGSLHYKLAYVITVT